MPKLVIVESPTKARTIRGFLPAGYEVQASMGHVRDLPDSASEIPEELKGEEWSRLGVNVHADFEPLYVIPKDKRKVVKELKEALKKADELILATDEDREGESISWHLQQVLQPKVPTRRMVFHEITREAIQEALQNCREVDEQLVRAQETRRILDRLVGYTLSPLLWKKIAPKLSAGRVQSVAVKLLVDRERERRAFRKASYWDLKAELQPKTTVAGQQAVFPAELVSLGGKRLANGQDFDPSTGQLIAGRDVVLLDQAQAEALRDRLLGKAWIVSSVEERPSTRKPAPPFTTSTLQQEANRKLHLSAQQTMRIAQKLYEEGYITYMRTDSVHLSEQAIRAARACVESMYGREYLSPEPRQYTTKTKGAQEAHEAIRPAGSEFRLPSQTPLSGQELALYDLIWKRTVASQMAEARQTHTIVLIAVDDAVFRASGKRIDFPGFFRAYVEGSDDPEAALEDREVHLPLLRQGDPLRCQKLEPVAHETQPPARYTEASLVKVLESEGIGRPSTYATILNTIMSRGYVRPMGSALVPTYTAFAVTELLEKYFPNMVNTRFTAEMEQTLDDIASGQAEWLPYLRHFFLGEQGLEGQVKARELEIDSGLARSIHLENLPVKIGIGPYGPYVAVETESGEVRANLPEDIPPADLSAEHIAELIQRKQEGPKPIAFHPETQEPIYVIPQGPYGPYVQLGEVSEDNKKPKRTSLPKGLKPDQVTPEIALGLLSLPRTLGEHPESGKKVQAGIGRFGPYVVCDGDFRSLPADEDVLTISLERALELLAQPKKSRGRASAKPLRELGSHPEDGEPVHLHDGPYGLYVKHGKVNASLPKEIPAEAVTLEMALQVLAEKEGSSAEVKGKSRSTGKAGSSVSKTQAKTASRSPTAQQAGNAVPQKRRKAQTTSTGSGMAKEPQAQANGSAQVGSRSTIVRITPKARA